MTLLSELTDEATARDDASGWSREVVAELPEVRDPELLRPWRRAYLAAGSCSVADNRTHRVLGKSVSDGQIGRLYLRRTMTAAAEATGRSVLAKRVPWRRDALQFTDRRPAYFFAGQQGGPFSLVDMTACYASIYSRLSLDLTYRPDCDPPLIGIGRAPFLRADEWLAVKEPRNAMWGSLIRPRVTEWRHGEQIDNALPNRYFAPDLVGIVFDVVHSIAAETVERWDCCAWTVDAAFLRPDDAPAWIEWLRARWGLDATVRAEGPGWLFGCTSWSVGPDVTLDVQHGRAHEWAQHSSLREIEPRVRDWLAGTMRGLR